MIHRLKARGAAALAVLALAVAAAAPARAQVFSPETFTLSNGMEVVVVSNHRIPVVTHMVWYKAGAADEPWGKSGVAHVLEHMMFKGTDELEPGEFSRIVAENGGQENAFTSYDYTAYYQNVAKDRLETLMRMEADRMVDLVLDPVAFNTERDVVLEERRQRVENDPSGVLSEMVRATQYLNHPYRIPLIGWEHELRQLNVEDLQAFYEERYAPNNAILVVAGDITAEELKPLAEKHYGRLQRADVPPRVRLEEPPHHGAKRVTLRDPQVRQPSVTRSYLAPSYTAGETRHAYALEVLSRLLGGGPTSRLYRSLVIEKELAVSAGTSYSPDNLDLSQFTVYASPRPGVGIAELEAAIDAEIGRLLRDGVSEEDVARERKRLKATAIYARDDYRTAAYVLGQALASGQTVADVEAWPERIDAVGVEDVMAAARAVLDTDTTVTGVLLPDGAPSGDGTAGTENAGREKS